jgi:hypothetical protein
LNALCEELMSKAELSYNAGGGDDGTASAMSGSTSMLDGPNSDDD